VENAAKSTNEVRPFRLDLPQDELDRLRDRLERGRWVAGGSGAGWDYGVLVGRLRELVAYWRTRYELVHADQQQIVSLLCHCISSRGMNADAEV
jgi:hypothetical protein